MSASAPEQGADAATVRPVPWPLPGTTNAAAGADSAARRRWAPPRVILTVYAIALGLIAIWPVPVDGAAGPLLDRVTHGIPWLTYARLEFAANILLFVPLGLLLAVILTHRYLILPIAIVTTVAIESIQALMLARRTPSVMDIIANVAGACIGLLIVAIIEWSRRRRE